MQASRFIVVSVTLLLAAILLGGCQGPSGSDQAYQWQPLFGNGLHDSSPVIARVGEITITQKDLDLRFKELPRNAQDRYEGEEGQRLLLQDMVEQALMVIGAAEKELFNDPEVAQTLVSMRRQVMDSAMRERGLDLNQEPPEEEIRSFFDNNRHHFRQEALLNARHIECLSEKDAQEAYDRLKRGGMDNDFAHVAADYTRNLETAKNNGDLGWFNKGGFLPNVSNAKAFTEIVGDFEVGLHPPFRLVDRWHVVEILNKERSRPMTFKEARGQVVNAMKPGHQERLVQDFLAEARQRHTVKLEGRFAPGQGLSPEALFARGMALADAQAKLDMFALVYNDFPDHEKADDALFMAAMVTLEKWQDGRAVEVLLRRLIRDYPDSELVEDAQFLRDNQYNPKALNPESIEDLRQSQ
jgi:peptidyl-prolyl cis-trans isomerase C